MKHCLEFYRILSEHLSGFIRQSIKVAFDSFHLVFLLHSFAQFCSRNMHHFLLITKVFVTRLQIFWEIETMYDKKNEEQLYYLNRETAATRVLPFGRDQTCVLPVTGRTASGQRPADRCQRRVAAGKNQPGRHGDAAQVHVDGGEQARDDPADRGPAGDQTERGEAGWE